jgi:hypothetical protein
LMRPLLASCVESTSMIVNGTRNFNPPDNLIFLKPLKKLHP